MTREKAIEILKQRECCRECVADCSCDECENAFDMAIKALEQEPKKGHWINKQHLLSSCSAECSSCQKRSNGYVFDNGFSLESKFYDFCPNCGAKMVEPQESEVEDGKKGV